MPLACASLAKSQIGSDTASNGVRGRAEAGVRAATPGGSSLDVSCSYDGIGSTTYHAVSGRAAVRLPLN